LVRAALRRAAVVSLVRGRWSMRKDMTALQWLAPSMARDGLIRNSEWIPGACEAAVGLFADGRLHVPATLLAALNPYAIDYIRQAPVLVVAAASGARLIYRRDRLRVAHRFIAASGEGPRLHELMKSYGLAPPLRALSGRALRHDDWGLLRALSGLAPAALAQSIPRLPEEQRRWLDDIARWRMYMWQHSRDVEQFFAWAAANLHGSTVRRNLAEIADFVGNNRRSFNTRWSLAQAKAASDRWHAEIARRSFGLAAMAADWRVVIDYAPLPSQVEVAPFTFHALQTREDIYLEGQAMRHCVRTYADRVAQGLSRLYSVRQGGARVATLELWPAGRPGSSLSRYALTQLKGHCNARPDAAVASAVAAFVDKVNEIAVARSAAPVVANVPRAADDPRLLEARQRIHGACLAWGARETADTPPPAREDC
jgi:hypothetical protein